MTVKDSRFNNAVANCRAIFAKHARNARAAAVAEAVAAGINPATVRTQWQRWTKKYDEGVGGAHSSGYAPDSVRPG